MRWSNIAEPADGLPPLREIIARDDLRARRKFGQNFILDMNMTRRIARAAGDLREDVIVEIGAGPGGLTRALLHEGARHLHVIEADTRFAPALNEIAAAYPDRLTVHLGDARALLLDSLIDAPYRIIANLPYNVATPLLVDWLKAQHNGQARWRSLTLMLQKEMAERLIAAPNTRAYGRLSVLCGAVAEARRVMDIDPRVFVPPPKVTSTLVHITPRAVPLAKLAPERLETVTAAIFGQRRKMLRASLKPLCSDPEALCARLKLDPKARAQTLTVPQICALALELDI